jgi:retron-type reverse transcriptase
LNIASVHIINAIGTSAAVRFLVGNGILSSSLILASVDGQTWFDYEKDLEANLQSLLDRAKSGTYRAPPVRRVYIPKAGSTTETRPIGIPTV